MIDDNVLKRMNLHKNFEPNMVVVTIYISIRGVQGLQMCPQRTPTRYMLNGQKMMTGHWDRFQMVNCSMFCIDSERNFEGAQLGWKSYLLFCAFYPSIMVWYIPGVRSGVGVELVLDSYVLCDVYVLPGPL